MAVELTYSKFENEALKYCKDKNISLTEYNQTDRNKLHSHMHTFVAEYYKPDVKKIVEVCKRYELLFWSEQMAE